MVVVGEVAVAVEVANGGVVLVGVAVDSGTEPPCTFPATATS